MARDELLYNPRRVFFVVEGECEMRSIDVRIGGESAFRFGENLVKYGVGSNCVIGANAVVNRDIPDNCVAAGVPARVICSLAEALEKLERKLEGDKYFSTW